MIGGMQRDVVDVAIKGVMPTTNGCAVFLGPPEKTFIIYIDQYIGNAMQLALKGQRKERPLTHDFIGDLLRGLDVTLERVVINGRNEDTFFARAILSMHNEVSTKVLELDARPSDCMVLALQMHRPIYVARTVLDAVEDMTELLERIVNEQKES